MDKYEQALKYEIFKNKEYWFLDNIIKQSNIVFDIWWHLGYFSEYCLEINQSLIIHFFEPVKESFEKAQNRINHMDIYWNNSAIMDKNGISEFFINSEKTMQSSFFNKNFLNPMWVQTNVIIEKLDEYIDNREIDRINLMKIDIEWSEFDVIRNMWNDYLNMIDNICIEYHILDQNFPKKLDIMIDKLNYIYKYLDIIPNKYTDKVWYIFARK